MSVELAYRGEIAVLTLNRPQALNALNASMIERIGTLIDEVAGSTARALIVVGAGGKAFCAGADVKELLGKDRGQQRETAERGQATFAKLDHLRMLSVAVITGVAFGGGLELAMACSFRIATAGSRFALPEIKLGLIPGYGGTQRLPRLVGTARALELIASGRVVGAEEAERIGLIHRIVEDTDPVDAGVTYLAEFGERFPAALCQATNAAQLALGLPLSEGLRLEADLFATATQTQDAAEGIRAFIEKRKPAFSGL
jgi:enoyl-CoA hydratase